jgi:hypothetical protein
MASVNRVWAALIARWDEIEAMFDGKVGHHWARRDTSAQGLTI